MVGKQLRIYNMDIIELLMNTILICYMIIVEYTIIKCHWQAGIAGLARQSPGCLASSARQSSGCLASSAEQSPLEASQARQDSPTGTSRKFCQAHIGRRDVHVWIHWNMKLRFVAICKKEGGVACRGVLARIESILCNWQPLDPAIPPLHENTPQPPG